MMKAPNIVNIIKKISQIAAKRDLEKLIFKILAGIWLLVIFAAAVMGAALSGSGDIEKQMIEAATGADTSLGDRVDMGRYESLLALTKYPEGIEKYSAARRDPFSEYKGIVAAPPGKREYDLILQSVSRMPLPLVYRGYIELPDRLIGQINWRQATRFVEPGAEVDGYRIRAISKEKIEAQNAKGEAIDFALNKPVVGEELQATLYDKLSQEVFEVSLSSTIGKYKVIDIAPDYVILMSKGKEIKIER